MHVSLPLPLCLSLSLSTYIGMYARIFIHIYPYRPRTPRAPAAKHVAAAASRSSIGIRINLARASDGGYAWNITPRSVSSRDQAAPEWSVNWRSPACQKARTGSVASAGALSA